MATRTMRTDRFNRLLKGKKEEIEHKVPVLLGEGREEGEEEEGERERNRDQRDGEKETHNRR